MSKFKIRTEQNGARKIDAPLPVLQSSTIIRCVRFWSRKAFAAHTLFVAFYVLGFYFFSLSLPYNLCKVVIIDIDIDMGIWL